MIDEKDIVDVIADEMTGKIPENVGVSCKSGFFTTAKWIKSHSTLAAPGTKKNLITESEVRKILAAGSKTLKITKDAIIGPLALEIIQEKGIRIVKE